ncbi:TIR domain-containing protein [Reyranella sp.]|uniref:TIR domain-containing protein n=1 Tax=Reyranella sp. TaxID=1929291 RepID=UPI0011FA3D7E|nr:TIR domain-containing protein [Reyranella sp.]TAJ82084.1 MAG: hypothetical protein EPO50_27710 [Reyranella sp.]
MAYRSGTYVAFHAEGTSDPTESDMKYYRLLQAWDKNKKFDFRLVNSHDKVAAVRDTSKRATLEASLRQRLSNSRNVLLIIGKTTKLDDDWIPFEIAYAVDKCTIPIIAAYTDYVTVTAPAQLRGLWPKALALRIANQTARVIHIPFKQAPVTDAVGQFDHNNLPKGAASHYGADTYRAWGLGHQ